MVENHVSDPQIQSMFVVAWKKQIKHRSGHVWLQDLWDLADRPANSVAEDFRRLRSQESCAGRSSKGVNIIPTCGSFTYNIILGLINDVEVVSILFIVSMGGIGRIKNVKKDGVELMLWVCVYSDFDLFNVSKGLFWGNHDFANANLLQVALKGVYLS
ncbi:hypothetical protein HanRHA438_Chr13g0612781 [Helianthus annuus]|uniref:Uncharacterized protein n=1 Tax=Helianthus annuus TaxID=4232 RepID=A0A9K3HDK6_HELAN|nr:hypothetical protein HanXRQr2_Chr13g0602481 [Helianthus annuus]KAJ0850406.1 hypothetical protein HanPSC8_Chr13g0580451 [Helianthus annuus]KAJ0859448.1 hypothetical protein HanRHA438_Chr13g0612781 [Helianthus annuus]